MAYLELVDHVPPQRTIAAATADRRSRAAEVAAS
jgi:hypothetical protein